MRTHPTLWVILGLMAAGCGSEEDLVDGIFTQAEWEKVQTLSPLPEKPPLDTTNQHADSADAAKLGQRFFFEKGYSGPILTGDDGMNGGLGAAGETGKIACANCHQGPWMIDLHSNPNNASLGTDWIPRNANSIVNATYYSPWVENNGVSDSFWSDALVDPEFPIAMNGSRLKVVHVIYDKYKDEYNAIFDPDLDDRLDPTHADAVNFPQDASPLAVDTSPAKIAWDSMTPADQKIANRIFANFGKAIEAYMRLFISGNSPFDRYVAGDYGAITASAKSGLKLFIGKAGCVACHDGPHFSDDQFHVNGLAPQGEHIVPTEAGRYDVIQYILGNEFNANGEYSDDRNTGRLDGLMQSETQQGQWRTKALRQAKETAPYMHTGQFATLKEVITFYNQGGDPSGFVGVKDDKIKPLNLSDQEVSDLVAFLESLTGEPVPTELLQDTSVP